MDRFDKATRARVMSRNKSKGTKTTEWRFRSLLMRSAIRGWRLGHDDNLPGKPDFIFARTRLAIFLDGCFWHGCRRCRSIPKVNRAFWLAKIQGNKKRDKKVVRMLRGVGWKVIRIWEHELRIDIKAVLHKILLARKIARPRSVR